MPRLIFVSAEGAERPVEGSLGQSVMELARQHGVDGIVGECGGLCSCATCHVTIDPAWQDVVGPPSDDEAEMLEFAVAPGPRSRLSCQIRMRREFDGLIVHTPARQR